MEIGPGPPYAFRTMSLGLDFKYGLRSRSLRFMRDRHAAGGEGVFSWRGRPVYYRAGTSDMEVLYRILLKPRRKREYQLPLEIAPRVVLDIGANIGATALLLADAYPRATIHCFEPVTENVALLRRNVAPYGNVQVHPFALGDADRVLTMYHSDDDRNQGGFSFFAAGSNTERRVEMPIRHAGRALEALKIGRVDLIKVDTEGAEYDILTALPTELLHSVGWILGELHGNRDFALLDLLSAHFDVAAAKTLDDRLFMFRARNRALSPAGRRV